jgi:hypothetical protein
VELGRPDDAPRHRAAGDEALLLKLALLASANWNPPAFEMDACQNPRGFGA